MKQIIKTYRAVAAMLAVIVLASVGLTALSGGLRLAPSKDDRYAVLTTTYPLYVAAQNLIGSNTPIRLTRLEGAASGCLHDYQMSPSDRRAVQEAQLILMNGAGAESFLHGIVDEDKCVDTSVGVDLICSDHHHDHDEGDHHHEDYNEHLWLSPARYERQVLAVMNALIALDKENESTYRSNAENYLRGIYEIRQEMETLAVGLSGRPCVLFHDSIAYLAADLGLDVKLTLSVEGESGLSAADLKKVEALAESNPDLLLFYDTQYSIRYEGVGGTALSLNTAVVGEGTAADWLTAMKQNIHELKRIGGDAP